MSAGAIGLMTGDVMIACSQEVRKIQTQDLHSDANPTTYVKAKFTQTQSHTQALRFGTAQPFWTLSQRCCSNKKTHEPKQQETKAGLNHVAVLDFFFAVSLGLEPEINRQLNCKFVQTFKIHRSFSKKTSFTTQ